MNADAATYAPDCAGCCAQARCHWCLMAYVTHSQVRSTGTVYACPLHAPYLTDDRTGVEVTPSPLSLMAPSLADRALARRRGL